MHPSAHGVEAECCSSFKERCDQEGTCKTSRNGCSREGGSSGCRFDDFPLIPSSDFEKIAPIDELTIWVDLDEVFLGANGVFWSVARRKKLYLFI